MAGAASDAAAGASQSEDLGALLPELVRFAYGLTGSRGDAEDLTQGAIERFLKRPRAAESPRAYLRRSILNAFLRQRDRSRALGVAHRLITPTQRTTVERPGAALTDIERALAVLSPLQRAVVMHRYLLDRSIADTAADLSMPQGSVRRIASEAIALLRLSPLFQEAE